MDNLIKENKTIIPLVIDTFKTSIDCRPRKFPWSGIVIHHTGIGDRVKIEDVPTWKKLYVNIADWLSRKDANAVSSHYLIGRGGELTQIVDPEKFVAFHAGVSSFWHPVLRKWVKDCNDYFLGIELLGDGNKEDYSDEQYDKLAVVCKYLMDEYSINPNMIVGHEMIAPGRKDDPGKLFNWIYLFERIYAK